MVIRPNVFLGGVSIAYLGLLWCQAYQSQEELIKLNPENMKSSCVHIEMVYHVDSNEWCMS